MAEGSEDVRKDKKADLISQYENEEWRIRDGMV